jgi:hypothetical protein
VLIVAPATPLIRAKAILASTCRMVANALATVGDARNARNPMANPIAPKIANIPVLDTILHHCWLSVPEILKLPVGIDGNLSLMFCSATAEASIII